MSHTPTPWKISSPYRVSGHTHPLHEGQFRTGLNHTPSDRRFPDVAIGEIIKHEDAQLILAAVNSHQAMKEALEAIVARIDGVFDHPSLLKQGPLSIGHNDDVRRIAKQALTLANGGPTDE